MRIRAHEIDKMSRRTHLNQCVTTNSRRPGKPNPVHVKDIKVGDDKTAIELDNDPYGKVVILAHKGCNLGWSDRDLAFVMPLIVNRALQIKACISMLRRFVGFKHLSNNFCFYCLLLRSTQLPTRFCIMPSCTMPTDRSR